MSKTALLGSSLFLVPMLIASPALALVAVGDAVDAGSSRPEDRPAAAVDSPATVVPAVVGSPATVAPAAADSPATVVPAVVGSPATVAPAVVGSPATVVPAVVDSPATVAPVAVASPATVAPAVVDSPATVVPAASVDAEQDAASLADTYKGVIAKGAEILSETNTIFDWAKRIAMLMLILVALFFLFRWLNLLFRKVKTQIFARAGHTLKPIKIREYEVLTVERQVGMIVVAASILRYAVLALLLVLAVPLLFSLFPHTRDLAYTLFGYIVAPIKTIFLSIVEYIPNLIFVIIIWLCGRYLLKGLKYLEQEIATGRLKIEGFYPDWAQPTHNIVRFLVYAFMIAMIYPYLPGSRSGVFQGISIFVGLIVSLGSSTVIGNIIAGMVITYMRPFKIGDRIKLNDTIGNVLEKTALVTRIKTLKNEIVTIPNSFIMSSHTVNYTASAQEFGLIIHTKVSVGYDTDWKLVHGLLIESAKKTKGVDKSREPFVLETSLEDFYPVYQINAYIQDANRLSQIYSELHQNIQDTFSAAGINIESPNLVMMRRPEEAQQAAPSPTGVRGTLLEALSGTGAERIENQKKTEGGR